MLLPLAASVAALASAPAPDVVEGERLRAPGARVVAAPAGRALELRSAGPARVSIAVATPSTLRVRVRGRACGGAPELRVAVDGRRVLIARLALRG